MLRRRAPLGEAAEALVAEGAQAGHPCVGVGERAAHDRVAVPACAAGQVDQAVEGELQRRHPLHPEASAFVGQ